MKNIFLNIQKSFYSTEFYQEGRNNKISHNIKLILNFLLVVTLLFFISSCVFYVVLVSKYKNEVFSYVKDNYPPDLVIEVKDKTLTTNKGTEIIKFPFPQQIIKESNSTNTKIKQNMLVLAPEETTTDLSLFEKYDTYLLLTSKNVLSDNGQGVIKIDVLNMSDATIDKAKTEEYINKGFNFFGPLMLLVSLPVFYFMLVFISLRFVLILAIVSVLVVFVLKLQKINISYKEVFNMGIYTLIPVWVINILLFFGNIEATIISALIIFIILLYVNKDNVNVVLSDTEELKTKEDQVLETQKDEFKKEDLSN